MGLLAAQLRKEHAKLMPHVDELRVIADYAADIPPASLRDRLRREHAFLTGEFVPHMQVEHEALYPALGDFPSHHDSASPMSDAHLEIATLIDALGGHTHVSDASLAPGWVLDARRTLYQLYALLKIHLAEEEFNAPRLEEQLSGAEQLELAARLEFGTPPGEETA